MEKQVYINGEQYFTRDTERGETTLLLLHGWPDDGTIWRHQIDYFKQKGYRVVCIDWLGHGKSSIPKKVSRYNRFNFAKDIIDLLDELNVGKVHLIAHDYGATVAWEIAHLYGDRFESFVPLSAGSSVALLQDALAGTLFNYYWLILHGMPISRWYYLRNGSCKFHKKFEQHPDSQYVLDKLQGDGDKTFFTIWEKSNPAMPLLIDFLLGKATKQAKVTIPTLAIYPENDVWMTEGQMIKSEKFVDAKWEYVNIPNCGHWLQLEKPDEVNRILDTWLDSFRN